MVPNIGPVQSKLIANYYSGDIQRVFAASVKELSSIEGIGTVKASSIAQFDNFKAAEAECTFIQNNNITTYFVTDDNYPTRLINMYDTPTMLYYKGTANLNAPKIVAVVGTRNNTEYSKKMVEELAINLAPHNIMILSGLAFGVDALAHKAALHNNIPTVGVLAHGLDIIYPTVHNKLAADMLNNNGGLLTEFRSGTNPERHNFPTRNRIVAALADVVVVVETDLKGGSMITAELANGYNKDVCAYPGKVIDAKSAGCNYLIKKNKAALITCAADVLALMNWETNQAKPAVQQRQLFITLSEQEQLIVNTLNARPKVHIDELAAITQLTPSAMAGALLSLELQNVILTLPGKIITMA